MTSMIEMVKNELIRDNFKWKITKKVLDRRRETQFEIVCMSIFSKQSKWKHVPKAT